MKDFTLKTYKNLLLTLQRAGVIFITFENYCNGKFLRGKYVILRHDVDLKPEQSLKTAKMENELGICATYYFRIIPQSNKPEIIKAIAALGHEIGYHYEDLNAAKGNTEKAYNNYQINLNYFRQFYPVKTIAMHGSPREKYDNRDLWKKYNYRSFDIIGEPYFDFLNRTDVIYFTDTARMWNGDKYNVRDKSIQKNIHSIQHKLPLIHSTFDLIEWIQTSKNQFQLMISTHPQRWTDNKWAWWKEKIAQTLKNQVKAIIVR